MIVASKNLVVLASVVVVMLALQSCGTGTNIVAAPNSWNFSITGNSVNGFYYVGDTLKFQSTAPDNSIFQWTFGDGNSSIQATPSFAYYSIPYDKSGIISDTVTLVVNNDIYHSVVKTITLKPPVPRISKAWAWTGGFFKKFGVCCPSLSDQALNDTVFAITQIDDYNINVWGANIAFRPDSNYFSNYSYTNMYNATFVKYTKDTLFFQQNSGTKDGGYIVTYFHKF